MKNEVNRAFMAKTTRIYILLVTLLAATSMQARIFDKGERLYINMEAQSVKDAGGDLKYGWYSTTKNYNYAYFFKGSQNAWSTQVKQYQGSVWYVEAPAGDWEYVILTRHNSANPSWDTKITQTGDIWFYYYEGSEKKMREQNYIQNFYYNDGGDKNGANWEYVAPAPSGSPATWEYEDEQICKEAAGTQYVLQAKNYDYENTYCHSWFKYENNTWTRLDQSEWYTTEDRGHIALPVTLGGVNSDVYYFLQASRPSMCRLIRVRINQDCSEGAPGACKITSFVAVAADANVTDRTSAVNGVVAFDDKKNAGKLQIWCPDVDTLIIENADIETPQTFRLKGLDASSKKTYTLYAKFLEGSGCEASCQVTVEPPVKTPETHTSTGTEGDQNLTRFTEVDVKLTPDNQTSTYFMWTNSANNDTIIGTSSDNRNITFDAPSEATTITYYFLATNDPPTPEGNLITNGTFETKDNLESKYDYWGMGDAVNNYYDSHTGASGGYAIVKDSYTFYHTYNSVKAHEGEYFGLFDSKVTTNVEDQAAWIAKSGTNNPKLKVQKGVSYLFSFWVANVNAFYQMNNGARLQFQISYNGGSTWSDLGGEINLGNYKDNRWHGLSSIATPTTSSTNVALRVINKNTSNKNIGNDFALDDIRFEAITASSSNIAGYEIFPVKYIACAIHSATFAQRQPIGCGTTVADVDFTVNFTNPRGDLYIYEGTTLLAKIPHSEIGDNATSYTGVLKDQPVDNADHTLTVYFNDGVVKTDAPTTYVYNARAVPAISVKSVTWGEVACDAATVTLTAVIAYTNQNGTLTANVDGGTSVSVSFTADSDDEKEVTLVIPGVAADGLANHKLNVNFSGTHGCPIADYTLPEAPVTPSALSKNFTFSTPGCTDLTTTLTFDLDYTYQQGTLHYSIEGLSGDSTRTITTSKSEQHLTKLAFEGIPADGNTRKLHVTFDGPNSCKKEYTLPACPFTPALKSVVVSGVPEGLACHGTSYNATVTVTTPYPADGKKVTLTYEDEGIARSKELTISGSTASAILTLHDAAGTKVINAAYADAPTCTFPSDAFDLPGAPSMDIRNFSYSTPGCDDETTTLTFDLDYTYQQGNLTYRVDGMPAKSQSITEKDKGEQHLTGLAFEGIPADGKVHTLYVAFDGPNSCDSTHTLDVAPFSPKITSVEVAVDPTALVCGAKNYNLTVTIKTPYDATGKNIVLSGAADATVAATGTQTVVPLTLENIGATGLVIGARYEDATACTPVQSDAFDAAPAPVCNIWRETICEGESYTDHGFDIHTPAVGEYEYGTLHDSLYLSVKEKPTITTSAINMTCDDVKIVRVPFSVVKGHPDNFDVEISGSHYAGSLDIVGTDTAFVFTPTALEAGDYSATITTSEGGLCESTNTVSFTIAISGQMYSKWTDVLFIGNKEGQYTGYQWFADGAAMGGETQQYLYDPNGLSGTAILYHCRLTTTDGKTLYTCPQTFDEVTPSRTVTTTPAQVKSTTMYDTMGRVIKGTPHNGIYIVSEELENGEIRTRKITIYE